MSQSGMDNDVSVWHVQEANKPKIKDVRYDRGDESSVHADGDFAMLYMPLNTEDGIVYSSGTTRRR